LGKGGSGFAVVTNDSASHRSSIAQKELVLSH
jgi:hypothetical protein